MKRKPKPPPKRVKRKGVYFRKKTDMLQIAPINMKEEKAKFFKKDCNYNPAFVYAVKEIKSKYTSFTS